MCVYNPFFHYSDCSYIIQLCLPNQEDKEVDAIMWKSAPA